MLSGLKDIYESLAMMARLQLDEPFSERSWLPLLTVPFLTRSPLLLQTPPVEPPLRPPVLLCPARRVFSDPGPEGRGVTSG